MDTPMKAQQQNPMVQVLQALMEADYVPDGLIAAQNAICQQYHFDRMRAYIRLPGTNTFPLIQESNYGHAPEQFNLQNGIDVSKVHSINREADGNEMLAFLGDNRYLHTRDLGRFLPGLVALGFKPTSNETVMEAGISTIAGDGGGVIGYAVYERFAGKDYLSEDEIGQVKLLCRAICDRGEKFETSKKLREAETVHNMDGLTGLFAFAAFCQEGDYLVRQGRQYTMISFDVDKFKYINELWGHEMGDEILVYLGQIVANFTTQKDRACRVGGDQFAILLHYKNQDHLNQRLAELDTLFGDVQAAFPQVKVTLIGGAYMMQEGLSIRLCVDRANIAKNSSKGSYDSTCTLYNQQLENLTQQEKKLEQRAAFALENNEFIPYLQPKFNIHTNEICGAEALARWQTAERLVPPSEFIPLFERNGFITRLDFAIYEGVFRFIQSAMEKGQTLWPISMNVSRGHMKDKKFCSRFMALMERYGVPVDMIELEITESVFIENTGLISDFINDIRKAGLRVSIDDFGTAYSSLNLLKDVDVDVIKLDKSLIDNIALATMDEDVEKDKIIIRNLINMIGELKFQSIFEGIETQSQIALLKETGCSFGQGFIFSKPLPLDVFEKTYLTAPEQ